MLSRFWWELFFGVLDMARHSTKIDAVTVNNADAKASIVLW
jgi:hypothetical protein